MADAAASQHPALARQEQDAQADFARVLAVPLSPEVRAALTPRMLVYAYEWFRDFTPSKAAARSGYPPHAARNAYRTLEVHAGITQAKAQILAALAAERDEGERPEWVTRKLRELHEISIAAVPVLDRKGHPTGEYRIDGGTAARCLELLGKARGMFSTDVKVTHGGEVRHLMAQVAARGKPTLEQRRALTIDHATGKADE